MSENFSINPNFNMGQFENSINAYNKVFSNSLNQANNNIQGTQSFDEIFNSMSASKNISPIQGNAQYFADMNNIGA